MRAFLLFCPALAGTYQHRQAHFSYGMADGTISLDTMMDTRYHAMNFMQCMALNIHNLLIFK
jgi:hypothetical protein